MIIREDDDYRPRRPTVEVGVQVDTGVDVGVQCDPEPVPASSSFGSHGFGSMAPPGMGHPFGQLSGYPYGMFGPMPPQPYPSWEYAGPLPYLPTYLPRGPHENPFLHNMFAAGGLGRGHMFAPAPRMASGTGSVAATREVWPQPRAPGAVHTPAGLYGDEAMSAIGAVDDNFRRQIEQLRQAAAKNRELLEKAGVHLRGRPVYMPAAASSGLPEQGGPVEVCKPAPDAPSQPVHAAA